MRLLICAMLGALAAAAADAPAGTGFSAFQKNVNAYLKVHQEQEKKVPALKPGATAKDINDHKSAFGKALRSARADAKQGDIFGTSAPAFQALLARELKGPENSSLRKAVKDENPAKKLAGPIEIHINETYPSSLPLSTMPPALLAGLPRIPLDLEYRVMGRVLILHDRDADMIVDFLPEATPKL